MDEPALEPLVIADWRRRIAELYAAVRAEANPETGHARWMTDRERLYRGHAASPVLASARAGFRALHFDYDPALRFECELIAGEPAGPEPPALAVELPVSSGAVRLFDRVGSVQIPFPDGRRDLSVFWLREYSGGLFLAFRDSTNGHETYGGGRYLLDTAKGADLGPGVAPRTLILDFNFAYQPSCAFDPAWSCPLAAPENRLDFDVRAGERIA